MNDDGFTFLPGGTRVSKSDVRLDALGALDELDAALGLLRAALADRPDAARIEAPDGSMVDDLPSIQRWLNRILALPIALQNSIFDEFIGLVEARIDAARQ